MIAITNIILIVNFIFLIYLKQRYVKIFNFKFDHNSNNKGDIEHTKFIDRYDALLLFSGLFLLFVLCYNNICKFDLFMHYFMLLFHILIVLFLYIIIYKRMKYIVHNGENFYN